MELKLYCKQRPEYPLWLGPAARGRDKLMGKALLFQGPDQDPKAFVHLWANLSPFDACLLQLQQRARPRLGHLPMRQAVRANNNFHLYDFRWEVPNYVRYWDIEVHPFTLVSVLPSFFFGQRQLAFSDAMYDLQWSLPDEDDPGAQLAFAGVLPKLHRSLLTMKHRSWRTACFCRRTVRTPSDSA